jgi:hypothetical protein
MPDYKSINCPVCGTQLRTPWQYFPATKKFNVSEKSIIAICPNKECEIKEIRLKVDIDQLARKL